MWVMAMCKCCIALSLRLLFRVGVARWSPVPCKSDGLYPWSGQKQKEYRSGSVID